ncbi:uncharacterized protein [Haliotis cracherodii]|uniref:uncharacterized protein n=1 Tax=Haliotis cracherodii TaxID=6455 RepID=UPI0039E90A07
MEMIQLYLVVVTLATAHAACTFPSGLQGTWTTGNDAITVNSTHLSGFSVDIYQHLDFTCFLTNGNNYAMKSSHKEMLFGQEVYIFICWELVAESSDVCRFYELARHVSENSPDKARAFFPGISPPMSSICQESEDGTISPRYLRKAT